MYVCIYALKMVYACDVSAFREAFDDFSLRATKMIGRQVPLGLMVYYYRPRPALCLPGYAFGLQAVDVEGRTAQSGSAKDLLWAIFIVFSGVWHCLIDGDWRLLFGGEPLP